MTLESWTDETAKRAIRNFVRRVTTRDSPEFVEPAARIAVFDNDGTLWAEKPIPVEVSFILQRLAAMAAEEPSLRERQPWKAAYRGEYDWLGHAVTRHHQGDDDDARRLIAATLQAFAGMSVESYARASAEFLEHARHPMLNRRLRDCVYLPMCELLRYLEAHGFINYIASGGDRDFMRVVTESIYGVPPERVIGSSSALGYSEAAEGGSIVYLAKLDVFDDGSAKPARIWSRIGRRPILACGNSDGDVQMLQFAGGPDRPALRVLLSHDDEAREFSYTTGAEKSRELARSKGWVIVSMKKDWKRIFA